LEVEEGLQNLFQQK